jgi:hypothetical protein
MKTAARITIVFVFSTVTAHATDSAKADTVLLFENSSGQSFGVIPQDYGDRVTASVQSGYHYGGTADTPKIVVDYVAANGWPSNYGDLTNVAYPATSSSILSVKLSADPGYRVALQSFDLAGWPSTDYTINSVQVRDGNGFVLFSQSNLLVEGDSVGPRHTTLSFAPLIAPTLQVSIDATNITAAFGAENVGLDNLRFSQVPEPASVSLLLMGSLCISAVVFARRAKKQVLAG